MTAPPDEAPPAAPRERVADEIRAAILGGEYPNCGRLYQTRLARQHGAGPAVVRQALEDLRREGLVSPIGGKGCYWVNPAGTREPPEHRPPARETVPANPVAALLGLADLGHGTALIATAEQAAHRTACELADDLTAEECGALSEFLYKIASAVGTHGIAKQHGCQIPHHPH